MQKTYSLLISFLLLLSYGSAHAQYTQMIVDDNNRVMPIFFHEPITHQPVMNNFNYPQTMPSPIQIAPIPQRIIRPATPRRNSSRNPLSGPYYISPARHRIMDAAHSALGIPYIYGGNNPAKGLDCSSLMQFIHKGALGVSIPRTAAQQRDRSKTIAYHDLQPGDMLFFKINRRSNHVGIYIGNGKFIHASSSNRKATIASMNLPYWQKRFVKFGSYLGS